MVSDRIHDLPIYLQLLMNPTSSGTNKAKWFWSFVKSLKKDVSEIPLLQENGILKTEAKDKHLQCPVSVHLWPKFCTTFHPLAFVTSYMALVTAGNTQVISICFDYL